MMTDLFVKTLYYLSAWTLLFLVLSWIIASFYPLVSRGLARLEVKNAALSVLVYGLLAPAAALLSLIILLLPGLAFSIVTGHCHGRSCVPHTLHLPLNSPQSHLLLFATVCLLAGVFVIVAKQLLSYRKTFKTLSVLAESVSPSCKVIECQTPMALCSGLIRPEIFVSRGLVDTLSPEQIRVVLNHEQAHVNRRDNLRKWALYWATVAWPMRYKNQINRDLHNYTEQVCDLSAVRNQRELHGLVGAMAELRRCYCSSAVNETFDEEDECIARMQALKKSWELRNSSAGLSKFGRWLPTVFVSVLCILVVFFAVHVGHPVLEWVAA